MMAQERANVTYARMGLTTTGLMWTSAEAVPSTTARVPKVLRVLKHVDWHVRRDSSPTLVRMAHSLVALVRLDHTKSTWVRSATTRHACRVHLARTGRCLMALINMECVSNRGMALNQSL